MLALYRRHRQNCKAEHPRQFANTEYDERKKGWKRCDCQIFVSGTLNGKFKRTTTGQWEWEQAHNVAALYEAAGNWERTIPAPLLPTKFEAAPERTTIDEAIKAFLINRDTANIKPHTVAKYRTMTNQLLAFAENRGFVYIDQFTTTDIDAFYVSWKDGIRTRAKKLDRLKSFIKFCLKRKWIPENLTEDITAPEGSSIPKQKTPFSDDDIHRLHQACDKIKRTPRRDWDGEDIRDFIDIAIHTGLRISDIVMFNIHERMNGNNILLRAQKNGANIYTWIPSWLLERLKAREKVYGALIFRAGTALNSKQMTQIWRDRRLRDVFHLAAPWKNFHPTPHLFRHSFVRILLERGVLVEDVAQLIGDTPETVRKFYSAWIPERQARLTKILQEAFDDKPKPPNVVAIR